jgi:hypothetical protein
MAKPRFDAVIEAVRYTPNGQIDWVRAYERRGPTFSDCILIDRSELVERLKRKTRFFTGRRIPFQASTFELGNLVTLGGDAGQEIITSGEKRGNQDDLHNVPLV